MVIQCTLLSSLSILFQGNNHFVIGYPPLSIASVIGFWSPGLESGRRIYLSRLGIPSAVSMHLSVSLHLSWSAMVVRNIRRPVNVISKIIE